jgi:hypothetical protein
MSSKQKIDFTTILAASFYSTFRMIAISACGGIFVKFKVIKGVNKIRLLTGKL